VFWENISPFSPTALYFLLVWLAWLGFLLLVLLLCSAVRSCTTPMLRILFSYSVLKHCAHIRCTHIVCSYSIRSAHVYYCPRHYVPRPIVYRIHSTRASYRSYYCCPCTSYLYLSVSSLRSSSVLID
jgi:hypothetical protein